VVGCETSPQDPANCATGSIVFTATTVTVDVPACPIETTPYKVVAYDGERWTLDIAGNRSLLALMGDGSGKWDGCEDGRVGAISFERQATKP